MNNYYRNKAAAVYRDDTPTLTDQSGADDTDINVIIRKFAITGTAPAAASQPIYADLSEMPEDLRGMIEQSRNVQQLRNQLPEQLRDKPVEELLMLSPEDLIKILTPAAPAKPEEEAK